MRRIGGIVTDFKELFAVNSEQALNFFWSRLKEEVPQGKVTEIETLYVASILAHYAQTSRNQSKHAAPSGSLFEVLDTFVLPLLEGESSKTESSEVLEIAGSQVLFLNGFFRDQMSRRHQLQWYDKLGSSFYFKAGEATTDPKKSYTFQMVATNFSIWVFVCRNLNRRLQEEKYMLHLN